MRAYVYNVQLMVDPQGASVGLGRGYDEQSKEVVRFLIEPELFVELQAQLDSVLEVAVEDLPLVTVEPRMVLRPLLTFWAKRCSVDGSEVKSVT